jgi:chorismate synthase
LKSNHSGGTLGGISTGETFHFKVAFKPVSTISKTQKTSNYNGEMIDL